ncbi:ATP-binding cassette domain-containing protein [Geosporobacter ferrireducens]|uniref:ABC transporter ATP-binding protein n=1 Tax=Geosporobacter ferrireducens TaxID=1424294 RepID=A0A1D8GCM5_9FIRM|nr:ATP-binding cassette domain-containing protein [Geosporobacter ferrireducens]AOT68659.1 energy-coupling factor ABC transporter ATP-binding protein [Geosporobacter ferrireducens]MTI54134.1 ATP-binding cassette domain-containing protein [Geosporobacter ferrireducens]
MLKVDQLSYTYRDGTKALNQISFSIPDHSKVAILGPNGSGKSTLFLHFNGIYLPQEGSVEVLGIPVNKKTEIDLKTRVGLVFQDPDDQVFSSTLWEDVAFGPENMGYSQEEIDRRVEKALKSVDMWDYRHKAPYHLSYGQKKRAAIAGILAMDCEIIMLDEPVAYLDPQGQDQLFSLLDELYQQGMSILIATHDVNLACEWADYIILMKDGQILGQGGTELLVQENLVNQARLRLPIVAKLFQKLNKDIDALPTTLEEAASQINQWVK